MQLRSGILQPQHLTRALIYPQMRRRIDYPLRRYRLMLMSSSLRVAGRQTDTPWEPKSDNRASHLARDIARKALQTIMPILTCCSDRHTEINRQRWHGSTRSQKADHPFDSHLPSMGDRSSLRLSVMLRQACAPVTQLRRSTCHWRAIEFH